MIANGLGRDPIRDATRMEVLVNVRLELNVTTIHCTLYHVIEFEHVSHVLTNAPDFKLRDVTVSCVDGGVLSTSTSASLEISN